MEEQLLVLFSNKQVNSYAFLLSHQSKVEVQPLPSGCNNNAGYVRSGEGVMFELFVGVLVGFACGYGVREYISRRRHAAARDWASLQARSRQAHIDHLKVEAKVGRTLTETRWKH